MAENPAHPEAIRGEVRARGFRRVSHGLFVPEREGLSERDEFLRDLEAARLVLPPDARFTHITGALVLGWELPPLPDGVPIFAATRHDTRGPRRPGILCSRLTHDSEPFPHAPVPVDAPEEILLRAARDLGVVDLAIMIASAQRLGHLDPDRVERILKSRRPGTRRLKAAFAMVLPHSESAGEVLLGLMHVVLEVAVEPQKVIRTPEGEFVARADFVVSGTRFLHEYDGLWHRTPRQQARDLRRDRDLVAIGRVRRGFVLADLTTHYAVTIHEIDRALGRPHHPSRITRWRRLVEESLYSPPGRRRLMNRWRRQMGVVEWSRTA